MYYYMLLYVLALFTNLNIICKKYCMKQIYDFKDFQICIDLERKRIQCYLYQGFLNIHFNNYTFVHCNYQHLVI